MTILRFLPLFLFLLFSPAAPAATLAVLQKNGEVFAMSADSEASVSHPKKIAQAPADGWDFVDAAGSPGLLYVLRADGAVFAVSPEGKVEPYPVEGWDARISRIVFHEGNLYGLDRNLDKRADKQIRVLDPSGATLLRVGMLDPLSAQDFAITGQGNFVILIHPAHAVNTEAGKPVTWTYSYTPGYQGGLNDYVKYCNFSSTLPGVLVQTRGENIHAISEKKESGESLWSVEFDGEDKARPVTTNSLIPAGLVKMEFSGDRALMLVDSDGDPELLSFKEEDEAHWDPEFEVKLPLKNVVGMGLLN